MRLTVIVALLLGALAPQLAGAQSTSSSTVTLTHAVLAPGQSEDITVIARDLAGHPLRNASVLLVATFGTHPVTYHLKKTDRWGRSVLSIRPPVGSTAGRVPLVVTIASGFLRQTVSTRFALSARAVAVPVASRTAAIHATATPTLLPDTATPVAALAVSASALPPHAVSPNPVYVVVNARLHNVDQPAAPVVVIASFKEGTVTLSGTTDAYGVATIKVDTGPARVKEIVKVVASVTWQGTTSRGSTLFDVSPASPGATSTSTSTAVAALAAPTTTPTIPPLVLAPLPSATPTGTPTPSDTPTPFPTPTAYPTPTDYPTPTPYPTYTPVPTYTAVPTSTPQPTPTATPFPTYTATPVPNCPGSQTGCLQAMLNIINGTRAQAGLYPLVLNMTQSNGTSSCAGSYGHSQAMAQSGSIWHTNPSYPAASFGNNLCVGTTSAAQNVGQYSSGNELTDLQQIHNLMMSEPHDASTCATQINHACNILTTAFHQIGIGIYFDANRTWLTEDFLT